MSNQLGPIDIYCDAPPSSIVHACGSLGFQTPMDVRWCRMSHLLSDAQEQPGPAALPIWKWFVRANEPKRKTCNCGEALPSLEWYTFTFTSGQLAFYRIGQCFRCRTIYWENG